MTKEQIALLARRQALEDQIKALRLECVSVQNEFDALTSRLELVRKIKRMGPDEKTEAIRILQGS